MGNNIPVWQPDINKDEEERKKREEEEKLLEKAEEENGGEEKKKKSSSSSSSSDNIKRINKEVDRATTAVEEAEDDIHTKYKEYISDFDRKKKRASTGIIGRTKNYMIKKASKLRRSTHGKGPEYPVEICNTLTLVEEILDQDDKTYGYNNHKKVKIEELDHFSEEEEEVSEDLDYTMDIVETGLSRTPGRRRRSSYGEDIYFYDDGEEIDESESLLYSRRGVVVQFPDDVDEISGEEVEENVPIFNDEVKKSLLEEEQISGNLLLDKLIQTYWNDPANKRIGFYPGVIQSYRSFNNDLQYEVRYESGNVFWEIIDDGVIFHDEALEEVKKK